MEGKTLKKRVFKMRVENAMREVNKRSRIRV